MVTIKILRYLSQNSTLCWNTTQVKQMGIKKAERLEVTHLSLCTYLYEALKIHGIFLSIFTAFISKQNVVFCRWYFCVKCVTIDFSFCFSNCNILFIKKIYLESKKMVLKISAFVRPLCHGIARRPCNGFRHHAIPSIRFTTQRRKENVYACARAFTYVNNDQR